MDFERIFDFIFPPVCIKCQKIGEWICSDCYKKYFRSSPPECMLCRRKNKLFTTHKNCLTETKIDRCIICWRYDKLSKKIMRAFKYDYRYAISNYLADKVVAKFGKYLTKKFILIPVPCHKSKLKERGFNQSKVLATKISKLTGLEILKPLRRIRDSPQHAGMNRQSRISDVNPFRLIPEFKDLLKNNNVMLIDDVCTTGTTLIQCATELRKADPRSITALALFRGRKK